jgi:hypothetical protein
MTVTEEEFEIVKVEELQSQGINVSDIAKLQSAGICSVSVSKTIRRRRFRANRISRMRRVFCQQPDEIF